MEQDGRPTADGEEVSPSVEPISWDQVVESTPPIAGESLAATIGALADPATRSPIPDTCPFFRTVDDAGVAAPPIEAVHPANRCVAVGEPTPQSPRQQELVCLTSGHNNCPLYLRGSLVAADSLVPLRDRRTPSTPVVASALLLVAATAMSVGFLLVRGSFDLPAAAAASAPSQAAVVASPSSVVSSPAATIAEPSVGSTDAAAPPATPPTEPPATPTPTPAPPTPAPTPAPPTPPAPRPTSDRYLLLVPCPNAADCWIYTVRAGDNLRSIVNYFGVEYGDVLSMNPAITNPTNIHAGDEIRMPPPTR
ncbi:MAG TPA: LysM domain-containing protein [Candidatus Limnocylindrales bacterium]|nr:LysM domain-containing protein [Candidatus Limnocylindrales bacterium]